MNTERREAFIQQLKDKRDRWAVMFTASEAAELAGALERLGELEKACEIYKSSLIGSSSESHTCSNCEAEMMYDEGEPWDAPSWGCPGCGHSVAVERPAMPVKAPERCEHGIEEPGVRCGVCSQMTNPDGSLSDEWGRQFR